MKTKRKSVIFSICILLCCSIFYTDVDAKIQGVDSIREEESNGESNDPQGPEDSHCVSGQVWLDLNGNGLIEEDERSVSDVRVKLQDHTGDFLGDRLTDHLGSFTFENLKPGSYSVEVVQPFGIKFIDDSNQDPTEKWYNVESVLCTSPVLAANVPVQEDVRRQIDIHVRKETQNGLPCAKISWIVHDSTNIHSFNILRSLTGKKSDAVDLKRDIPIRVDNSEYNYIEEDILVQSGIIYDYWIEVVSIDNQVTSYRPVHLQIFNKTVYKLHLPIIFE